MHFSSSLFPSQGVLDDEFPLVESPEFNGSIIYGPEVIVDFLEPYIFAAQDVADVDPITVPSDAAVTADKTDVPVSRVLDGWQ